MKHIDDNNRTIGKKTYFATNDPNIIRELSTEDHGEIHLDKLLERQSEAQRELDEINALLAKIEVE